MGLALFPVKVVMDVLALLLGIVGAIGVYLTYIALREARDQAKTLTGLSESLPTRDVGKAFPGYMGVVNDVVAGATESLVVLTDFPCYCVFSDRALWMRYGEVMQEAAARLSNVSICWMNSLTRQLVLRERFGLAEGALTPEDEARWRMSKATPQRLKEFLDWEDVKGEFGTAETITFDDFAALLEKQHKGFSGRLAKVGPSELAERPYMSFWIADSSIAVFAIRNFSDRSEERAFLTRDRSIINGLISVQKRLKAGAPGTHARAAGN